MCSDSNIYKKIGGALLTLGEVSSCYQQDILEVFLIEGKKGKN